MKIKCENVVVCGNYKCGLNLDGACIHTVIALDADGKCAMRKPNNRAVEKAKTIAESQNGGLSININDC